MSIIVYPDESSFLELLIANNGDKKFIVATTVAELITLIGEHTQGIFLLDYSTRDNPGIPQEKLRMIQFVGLEGVGKPQFIPKENWTNFQNLYFVKHFKELIAKLQDKDRLSKTI